MQSSPDRRPESVPRSSSSYARTAGRSWASDLSVPPNTLRDVSDSAAVLAAVEEIQGAVGEIDALVSAAGHYEMTPMSQISTSALRRMLRVHLGGLRNTARAVLPSMLARGPGPSSR